jgi:hypothetical protein
LRRVKVDSVFLGDFVVAVVFFFADDVFFLGDDVFLLGDFAAAFVTAAFFFRVGMML